MFRRNIFLLAVVIGTAYPCGALAQIATDGTLGPAGALAGPNYAVTANLGRQVGANLFHSFSIFNLTRLESATFSGPASVAHIINRVTGGSMSSIDGLLHSTIAGANLYLINPNGILFGPNASLDLTGSFHASTANYVKLADGGRFDATNPAGSVFTSAPPAAFGFLGPTPAPVTVQASNLSAPEGKSLSLVGGAVNLSDATLRTVAGDIQLIAMGGAGEVPLNVTGTSLAGITLAPIAIERSALVTASGTGTAPGRIVIRGGQVTVLDSNLFSTNHESANAPAIELAASGDLIVSASNVISSTDAPGRGADLSLSGRNVTVDHNAQVIAATYSGGAGGVISLTAAEAVRVNAAPEDPNYTDIYTISYSGGAAGPIRLSGDTVTVKSANVFSGTIASANSGSIALQGRDVSVIDGAYIFTYTDVGASGNAGNIDILATQRSFTAGTDWGALHWFTFPNPTSIFTATQGTGRAGDITIMSPEITMAGAHVTNTTYDRGNAGDIRITGDVIKFGNAIRSELQVESAASELTTGNGGNVEIRASRSFELNGSEFPGFARVAATTQGDARGGDIIIESPIISIEAGALFSRTRFGTGSQGGITLRADEIRMPDGGDISSKTEASAKGSFVLIEASSIDLGGTSRIVDFTTGSGNAGRITINAKRLKMTGSSSIDVTSDGGTGSAGDIVLNIGESFEMSNRDAGALVEYRGVPGFWRGGIISRATGPGNAGNIFLSAPSILLDDGRILATVRGEGHGGRVEVHAQAFTLRNGAQVDARAITGSSGNAGTIEIDVANRFEITGLSVVDGAFSALNAETLGSGHGGNVGIAAGTLVIDRGLIRSSAGASGGAGSIRILARDVVLTNGGSIDAGTEVGSAAAGGSVDVTATRSIVIGGIDRSETIPITGVPNLHPILGTDFVLGRAQGPFNSTISSNTAGSGAGGNVTLSAPQITIEDGGRVSANSSGAGNAGNIFIQAPDWLKLTGGSITTQALSGDGGNIVIRAGNRVHLRNAEISTSVGSGEGSGGNIFIDPTFVILENSRIVANAFGGAGGNINIVADFFLASPDSVVDASSQLGVSGSVQIAAPRTDPSAALALLPATLFDAASMLRESCAGRAGPRASSLVGVGRGGLAAAPDGNSSSRYFADTSLPLAQGDGPAKFAGSRATAAAGESVLLAACAY